MTVIYTKTESSLSLQCGGAVTVGSCNVCGSAIGGQNYNLVTGNQQETEYVQLIHSPQN